MAEQRTCDYQGCGAEGALPVIVSASVADAVAPGTVTGHEERADACAAHRDATRQLLFDAAWEILEAQIPIHQELLEATEARDAAYRAVEESTPRVEPVGGKRASELTAEDREAVGAHNALVAAAHAARDRRRAIAERGTALSDERRAKLAKVLAKKPAKK